MRTPFVLLSPVIFATPPIHAQVNDSVLASNDTASFSTPETPSPNSVIRLCDTCGSDWSSSNDLTSKPWAIMRFAKGTASGMPKESP